MALIIGGALSYCGRSQNSQPPSASVSRVTEAQLAACKAAAPRAERLGLIRERRENWIIVDERVWRELSWDQKKEQMICALVIATDGDLSGIVMVKGYRSGRVLAGGSPGSGTLSEK